MAGGNLGAAAGAELAHHPQDLGAGVSGDLLPPGQQLDQGVAVDLGRVGLGGEEGGQCRPGQSGDRGGDVVRAGRRVGRRPLAHIFAHAFYDTPAGGA